MYRYLEHLRDVTVEFVPLVIGNNCNFLVSLFMSASLWDHHTQNNYYVAKPFECSCYKYAKRMLAISLYSKC